MKARTIKGKSAEDIERAIEKCLSDGFRPTLAILFISIKQDRRKICALFEQAQIEVFGATSAGEFIEGHQSESEAVAMLLDIKKTDYQILFEEIGERTLSEAASNLAENAKRKFARPALIVCSTFLNPDGTLMDGELLIRSIEKVIGPQVTLFGGLAGDDMSFTGPLVFYGNRATTYGIVALVLDEDKIDFYGMAMSGWKPIGLYKTITKSEGNVIYTIDDKPALEVYLRFLGEDFSDMIQEQYKLFEKVGIHYPLQIEREGRTPLMFTPIGYDKEKKGLICDVAIPAGSKFRFSTPPDFDIVETVIDAASAVKNTVRGEVDAMLIFSCAGRLSVLGPMAEKEKEGIYEIWKVPMAGFYTYGEFGKAPNGKHEFHSTTCSWVAMREKL